ncbi:hypothetical protein DdX_20993 [Ditylenchus destructor]|uniref:F-box domain-containing protein n=1 Tax=Ditylenchus destructor TaxID=166010 RepID=A0AAD4MFG6_9BILA|nr:hypothetical protein DdX_20993 [Ditylenchus destructor]
MTSIKPSHDRRIPATNDRIKQKPKAKSTIDRWAHYYIVVCVSSSVFILVFIVCLVGDRTVPWWCAFVACAPLITWIAIWFTYARYLPALDTMSSLPSNVLQGVLAYLQRIELCRLNGINRKFRGNIDACFPTAPYLAVKHFRYNRNAIEWYSNEAIRGKITTRQTDKIMRSLFRTPYVRILRYQTTYAMDDYSLAVRRIADYIVMPTISRRVVGISAKIPYEVIDEAFQYVAQKHAAQPVSHSVTILFRDKKILLTIKNGRLGLGLL